MALPDRLEHEPVEAFRRGHLYLVPDLEEPIDLASDPGLDPQDQVSERVILYHLIQDNAVVSGAENQAIMRRELGLGFGAKNPLAPLAARGILRVHKHDTTLMPEQLMRAKDKPFFTKRVASLIVAQQTSPDLTRELEIEMLEEQKAQREEQRSDYMDELYRALGKNTAMPIPDRKVDDILYRHFPAWEHQIVGVKPELHYLTRQAVGSSVELTLPSLNSKGRVITDAENGITIKIEDDAVRAMDLRAVIAIEAQKLVYEGRGKTVDVEPKPNKRRGKGRSKLAETEGIYIHEGDVLTDTEILILSRTTRNSTLTELKTDLGTSTQTLQKIVDPLKERLGIESQGPDICIDLALAALSLEVANLDHLASVPENGRDEFTEMFKDLMKYFYSPDQATRRAYRNSNPRNIFAVRWSRLYENIFGKSDSQKGLRHKAVMYAVKNGLLELPDPEGLKHNLETTLAVANS